MSNYTTQKAKLLDAAIEKELLQEGKKTPIISAHRWLPCSVAITKILNKVRKKFSNYFNPSLGHLGKGDKTILEEQQQLYDEFENVRKEHRGLSYHYSAQYRGSYMLNYILAAVAVGLAVLCLGLLYISRMYDEYTRHTIHILVFGLGIIKFILLLVITINTREANTTDFNHRAITYRYIMEQLRCMYYLSLLGIHSTPPSSASQYMSGKWRNNYIEQYLRNKIKEVFTRTEMSLKETKQDINYNISLVPVLKFIKADWIEPQVQYHINNLSRQTKINERLEKHVNYLNMAVLAAVAFDILWTAISFFHFIPAGVNKGFHSWGTPVILITAAIIPALVASFNGIRFQTEARKLGERSQVMSDLLKDLGIEYDNLVKKIEQFKDSPENPGSFTSDAKDLVNKTAQLMINEVTEWTFIYAREVLDT